MLCFAVPPVTCVLTYALPVTEESGITYLHKISVRYAAQEGSSTLCLLPPGSHHPRISEGFRKAYCLHHCHSHLSAPAHLIQVVVIAIIPPLFSLSSGNFSCFPRGVPPFFRQSSSLSPAWPEKIQGAGWTSISSLRPTLETSSCMISVGRMPFSQSRPGMWLM